MKLDGFVQFFVSDWIRGDFLNRGKQETYLFQIVTAIIKRYGSQISWNNLLADLSIDHPKTVADYVEFLVSMDAALILEAIVEEKLTAAPKKAKKLVFTDPFIFHALSNWINPDKDPYKNDIKPRVKDADWPAKFTEVCAVTHFKRRYLTF